MKKYLLILSIAFSISTVTKAQLTITDSLSTADVANLLTGFGVNISNLVINCDPIAMGEFSGVSEIPITQGLLLTTGFASLLADSNYNQQSTGVLQLPGDPDLDFMIQSITYDACALEFDCVPQGDTLLFNFVFGSEEYPEFVGTFNDAFAILLSGPGINGVQNVAQLPNGDIVSINNVNANTNSAYFYDNCNPYGVYTAYDGFTQNLEVFAVTIPDSTYHFKVVIADNNDNAFDSGVLLEAFSFRSATNMVTGINNQNNQQIKVYPNPSNGLFTIKDFGFAGKTQQITVTDITGRFVENISMTSPMQVIDLSHLYNGIYQLSIGEKHQQILINK